MDLTPDIFFRTFSSASLAACAAAERSSHKVSIVQSAGSGTLVVNKPWRTMVLVDHKSEVKNHQENMYTSHRVIWVYDTWVRLGLKMPSSLVETEACPTIDWWSPRYWGVAVLAAKLLPTELTTGDPTHRLGPKRLRQGLPCHNPRIATKQKLCCTWKSAGRTIQVAQARDPKLMHQHLASEVRQRNVCDDVNRKIKWSQCLPIHQITASMSWMQRACTR